LSPPKIEYRENCERAVYVSGIIDQNLIDKLTPIINQYRLSDLAPITFYVDSPGGSAWLAESLRRFAKAPTQDGKSCKLITVVTGVAASAAADLLAHGDYAMAHQHTRILYHGNRRSAEELTYESASSLALSLQQANEAFAVRLARRAFPRFCFRLSLLSEPFKQYIDQAHAGSGIPVEDLASAVRAKVTTINRRLVDDALNRQRTINALSLSVMKHIKRFKRKLSDAEFEAEILKSIIGYKIRSHKSDSWLLSRQGLAEISNDFNLLIDFHFGSQQRHVQWFLKTLGELFLAEAEKPEYEQLNGEDAKLEWLNEHIQDRIQPLWYLMVSISRLLQTTDYAFEPYEAYWLGLVDEVCGSRLPNVREAIEEISNEAAEPEGQVAKIGA
jgi:hypothetical protein